MYIRMYVRTYVHTYIHTYIHTYMHTRMHSMKRGSWSKRLLLSSAYLKHQLTHLKKKQEKYKIYKINKEIKIYCLKEGSAQKEQDK